MEELDEELTDLEGKRRKPVTIEDLDRLLAELDVEDIDKFYTFLKKGDKLIEHAVVPDPSLIEYRKKR